jgi:hypothetical protein
MEGKLMRLAMAIAAITILADGLSAVGADSVPPTDVMDGPAEIGLAFVDDRGALNVQRFVRRAVEVDVVDDTPTFTPNGVQAGSTYRQVRQITQTHTTRLDAARARARRVDGRPLSQAAILAELRKPTAVLLVAEAQTLSPRYSKIYRQETVVLSFRGDSGVEPLASQPLRQFSGRVLAAVSGPPGQCIISQAERGALHVEKTFTRMTEFQVSDRVSAAEGRGNDKSTRRTEIRPLTTMETQNLPMAFFVARRVDGRTVSNQAIWQEVTEPTPVLFLDGSEKPDPRFVAIFKPETLVLSLSRQRGPSVVPVFTLRSPTTSSHGRRDVRVPVPAASLPPSLPQGAGAQRPGLEPRQN